MQTPTWGKMTVSRWSHLRSTTIPTTSLMTWVRKSTHNPITRWKTNITFSRHKTTKWITNRCSKMMLTMGNRIKGSHMGRLLATWDITKCRCCHYSKTIWIKKEPNRRWRMIHLGMSIQILYQMWARQEPYPCRSQHLWQMEGALSFRVLLIIRVICSWRQKLLYQSKIMQDLNSRGLFSSIHLEMTNRMMNNRSLKEAQMQHLYHFRCSNKHPYSLICQLGPHSSCLSRHHLETWVILARSQEEVLGPLLS